MIERRGTPSLLTACSLSENPGRGEATRQVVVLRVARGALRLDADEEAEGHELARAEVRNRAHRQASHRLPRRILNGSGELRLHPERPAVVQRDEQQLARVKAVLSAVVEDIVKIELQP